MFYPEGGKGEGFSLLNLHRLLHAHAQVHFFLSQLPFLHNSEPSCLQCLIPLLSLLLFVTFCYFCFDETLLPQGWDSAAALSTQAKGMSLSGWTLQIPVAAREVFVSFTPS
ncbi:hypothetical protein GQ42DRAFT_87087 [Ramicandelaber brevisporus]|nr:hypothetical protein GQ42DRAFT_87087 [Ramicandelaber brevisporus]